MIMIPKEKVIEFLLDIRDRKDELEQVKSQHENTHEANYYNGQLDELIRILDKSQLFFEVNEQEIDHVYELLQSYELGLKDKSGKGFQGHVRAFNPDHAKHKAEREYPDYKLVHVKRA